MSQEQNIRIARQFLEGISGGSSPEYIADLFGDSVEFAIEGDVGALPWIGRTTGRDAAFAFIRDTRVLLEQIRFDVQEILASDGRAVVVGELATRVIATGRIIRSAFAIVMTVSNGKIIRFQMLEDSFAVSRAARQ